MVFNFVKQLLYQGQGESSHHSEDPLILQTCSLQATLENLLVELEYFSTQQKGNFDKLPELTTVKTSGFCSLCFSLRITSAFWNSYFTAATFFLSHLSAESGENFCLHHVFPWPYAFSFILTFTAFQNPGGLSCRIRVSYSIAENLLNILLLLLFDRFGSEHFKSGI